ncbi:MAG: Cof-type HAD-IIB family hydrolase [Clostridia bacterium]|nr:Cof-type HAD-IIB family hydrolase [Clostridia bacterium]MBR3819000.1 Cof-type HAD-IIB family hydrolase [Clostridia bacterium]
MLNPKEKCAVFLDIDGTLLSDSFAIPPENLKAIKAAQEKGHLVFINTGRSWGNIPSVLMEQFKDFDGIISGIGSMITMGGETVFKSFMPETLIKRIMEYVFAHPEYWVLFEGVNNVYSVPNDKFVLRDYQILLENSDDYLKICNGDNIQVVAMGKTVPDDFKELFRDDLTVFQFETYADFVKKGLNKAEGIKKAIEIMGIKRENTVAIGDSNNDYDMITYAGVGVAMANSQQSILDIADYITDSNHNCGVAKAIKDILL